MLFKAKDPDGGHAGPKGAANEGDHVRTGASKPANEHRYLELAHMPTQPDLSASSASSAPVSIPKAPPSVPGPVCAQVHSRPSGLSARAPPLSPLTIPPPTSLEFVDRLMTPPAGFPVETRRRGRQATACLECNRRKQKCDRLQPCAHCAKRNLVDGCIYPDAKPCPTSPQTPLATQKRKSEDGEPFSPKREKRDEIGGSSLYPMRDATSDSPLSMPSERSHRSHRSHPFNPSFSSDSSLSSQSDLSSLSPVTTTLPRTPHTPHMPHTPHTPHYHVPSAHPSRTINRSIPVSAERHEVVTPPPQTQWAQYPDRPWRDESTRERERDPREYRNGRQTPKPDRRPSLPRMDDHLMQEGGAPGIGSLAKEGAEAHGHQFQFYGTSHFGPRLAAQVMHGGKPSVDISDSQYRSSSGDEDLLYYIHQLDSALPKRSLCRRFVDAFFERYNSWVDILHAPDFHACHNEFWITHSEFEDLTRIDLRWFALFHTVLAFGSLLDDSDDLTLSQRQAISDKCFVAARRALSEAPSFYGESLDTVAAYTLLSLYLVAMRRMPEAWHMVGSGVRAAQAQGFHVDGETWHLVPKSTELWRRLWAQMYILERSISYFLGRPLIIQEGTFTTQPPANMHDSELDILPRRDWPLTTTTRSTFLILHYKLAQIIGQILSSCFGLRPRIHADVMRCEELMVQWQQSLPPAFRLEDPDTSQDDAQPWIRLQRRTLISKFHQARISLHRPYLLPSGRTDYAESRMCCVTSAGVELRHRLSLLETDHDPFDRFKWLTVASGFSPACVLGLLLARAQREAQFNYDAIRDLLIEYTNVEKNTLRRDRTLENELAVLDMMLARANEVDAQAAQRSLRASKAPTRAPTPTKKRSFTSPTALQAPLPDQTYPPSTPAILSPAAPPRLGFPSVPTPVRNQVHGLGASQNTHPHPNPHSPNSAAHPASSAVLLQNDYMPVVPPLPVNMYPYQFDSGVMATLAPAPQYDDPPLFTFPSPMDPSADTFPPVHHLTAWAGLLEIISRPEEEE